MRDDRQELGEFAEELKLRVVYTMLLPSVRLAKAFKLSMKDVGDFAQMAYYHELKRQGLKMREASSLLDVSMRKVALLSKRLKRNFITAEREHGLPRRVEFMLWANPLSPARLEQAMPDVSPQDIAEALQTLESQGRVRQIEGRTTTYEVVRTEFRLVQDSWLARIDGLENLLGSVTAAVYARFFDGDESAFARTVSLRVRREDLPRLRKLYEEKIWAELVALDEAAKGDPEAESMDVSIVWAPYEYIKRREAGGEEP